MTGLSNLPQQSNADMWPEVKLHPSPHTTRAKISLQTLIPLVPWGHKLLCLVTLSIWPQVTKRIVQGSMFTEDHVTETQVLYWLITWPFCISHNLNIVVYQSKMEVYLYLCRKWGKILVPAVFTNTACSHSWSKQFSHLIQLFHLKSEKFVHQHCTAVERKSTR